MRVKASGIGFLAAVLALSAYVSPAGAGSSAGSAGPGAGSCRDQAGQVTDCVATREFAAQARPRITVYPRRNFPGPNAKRYCRSWLATEYRPSGTVITPQMACWWQ